MLEYENLDDRTRRSMLAEFKDDLARGALYLSPRLSERGVQDYPGLLRTALEHGTDASLANSLCFHGRLRESVQRESPEGPRTVVVPATAADTLAEGEFNHYYMRGLCCRALDEGRRELVVYRAKGVRAPRDESKAMLGQHVEPGTLLADLRARSENVTPAGVPFGPNSGLSVKLPD